MEAYALRPGQEKGTRFPRPLRRIAGDDRLVELVREGRQDAFEVLYDRYHRQILSFSRHMLGSREEAEDAVQQSFLSAYNALVGSDKPIQLRPWLYTIARNQCLSALRARRVDDPLDDAEPAVEGLSAEVQRREDLRDTLRDLAQLPDDQRAAIVLAELGALSHDEIADVVGCPKEKVKALVFQARSTLIAGKQARETPCTEIREQLATLRGGALRRGVLRRHIRHCEGCREFEAEVKQQRKAMAILLPVAPTAALKPGLLSAVAAKVGGGAGLAAAGGGAGVAGGGAATGATGLVAAAANAGALKLVVAGAIVVGGVGAGSVATIQAIDAGDQPSKPKSAPANSPSGPGAARGAGAVTPAGVTPTRARGEHAPGKQAGGVKNGKNPKGEHGRSHTAPGKAGTSPGKAGTSPGKSGAAPGQTRTGPTRRGIGNAGSGLTRRGARATPPSRARSGGSTSRGGGYGANSGANRVQGLLGGGSGNAE
jgi:RNA polymerase sigma factor (sigma-70 family)